jgi:hypothetical protein
MTINPFILRMFKHISFKSWLKIYRQNLEKRSIQKQLKGEIDVSDAEIEAPPLVKIVNTDPLTQRFDNDVNEEFFYETELDEPCEDDDSKDDGDKSSS